jgi:hypothetical protein
LLARLWEALLGDSSRTTTLTLLLYGEAPNDFASVRFETNKVDFLREHAGQQPPVSLPVIMKSFTPTYL